MSETPGMKELRYWIGATADPDKADGYASRLYERIGRECTDVEHLHLRAEATNAAALDEKRGELHAYQTLVHALQGFAGGRLDQDDTARSVYATISRFNLGEMFRPGGGADRYLIPYELTDPDKGES
ncbi:hypothetical protein [Streptomyces lydicus]|uniref:hypothetical protein n=1 Tax=Streptomyces lydicus TaxID=47763 RepID=UPI00378C5852